MSSGSQHAARSTTRGDADLASWPRVVLGVLAVVAVLSIWLIHIDTPWSRVRGFADWIGAQNARIAGNMQSLGLAETGGAQLLNLEAPDAARDWILYHGHPATLDLVTSRIFDLTGSRSAATQRLLPLLCALLGLLLLFRLARRVGSAPWIALAFFASYPLTVAHGINFSYEPLCIAAMLGIALLFEKGWRWGLAPAFLLGGLLDFPVLYLAPYYAALVFFAREDRVGGARCSSRRLVFGLVSGLACVASLALHFTHVILTGARAGNRGQGIFEKIFLSFAPKEGFEPDVGRYLGAAWEWFSTGFTPLGLALGCVALACLPLLVRLHPARAGAARAACAFAFAGALHCLAFRAHFVLHDFWPVYFTPALALASAELLRHLRLPARVGLTAAVAAWGVVGGLQLWGERTAAPVREVAADLTELFGGPEQKDAAAPRPQAAATLYQLRAPAGWALEQERGVAVYEGIDLAERLLAVRSAGADATARAAALEAYRAFVDNVVARGDLGRAQQLFLDQGAAEAGDEAAVAQLFTAAPGELRRAASGRAYRVWALERAFFEPWTLPAFVGVPRAELEPLAMHARLGSVAHLLPQGARYVVLDGSLREERAVRGIFVESVDASVLRERGEAPENFAGRSVLCAEDSRFAPAMRKAAGSALELRQFSSAARTQRFLIWSPPRS